VPDPLSVLLDAIWIEARWQLRLAERYEIRRYAAHFWCMPFDPPQDSEADRYAFWVMTMEHHITAHLSQLRGRA